MQLITSAIELIRQRTATAEEHGLPGFAVDDVEFRRRHSEQRLHGQDRVQSAAAQKKSHHQFTRSTADVFTELDHPHGIIHRISVSGCCSLALPV